MSPRSLTRVAALTLGFGFCPAELFGVSIRVVNWDFSGAENQGAVGNSLFFTPTTGGPSIKATAWYLDATGVFKQAALGIYANGLGVCYPGENCTDPNNQLDNSVFRQFIMLESSEVIDPLTIRIKSSGDGGGSPSDTDVTYWLGNGNQNLDLTSKTVGDLTALGFGARTNDNTGQDLCNGCSRDVALTSTGIGFKKLVFGGAYSGGGGGYDFFTINSMTANYVPEPSSVILFGTVALGCLHLVKRRIARNLLRGVSRATV